MFADSTSTALQGSFLLQFLLAVLTLGQVGVLWMQILGRKSAQRREVNIMSASVNREEFAEAEKRNEKAHAEMSAKLITMEGAFRTEMKDDAEKIHEKINGVAREVSKLTALTEGQNVQLVRISGQLDRLK